MFSAFPAIVNKYKKELAAEEEDKEDSAAADFDADNDSARMARRLMRRSGRRTVGDFSNLTHESRIAMTQLHAAAPLQDRPGK